MTVSKRNTSPINDMNLSKRYLSANDQDYDHDRSELHYFSVILIMTIMTITIIMIKMIMTIGFVTAGCVLHYG